MIEPFKPAPEGFHWVYVIIDKFSKWIEYKPLVSVWQNILNNMAHKHLSLSQRPLTAMHVYHRT
jgi:hypothetical protein